MFRDMGSLGVTRLQKGQTQTLSQISDKLLAKRFRTIVPKDFDIAEYNE